MAKYRYSHVTTIFGDEYWLVERKRLGVWLDDERFDGSGKLLDYVGQLKDNGNIVIKY